MKEEGISAYLKKGWRKSRWRRMLRFRMNNEMRGARYWKSEEKRNCRRCGGGEETWEHVLGECRGEEWKGNWWEKMEKILGQEGEGEWWMRELEGERRKVEGEKGGDEEGDEKRLEWMKSMEGRV